MLFSRYSPVWSVVKLFGECNFSIMEIFKCIKLNLLTVHSEQRETIYKYISMLFQCHPTPFISNVNMVYFSIKQTAKHWENTRMCCQHLLRMYLCCGLVMCTFSRDIHVLVRNVDPTHLESFNEYAMRTTGVKQCTFYWLISSELVQKQRVFNNMIIHHLIMITCISYGNIFAILVPKCIDIAPL